MKDHLEKSWSLGRYMDGGKAVSIERSMKKEKERRFIVRWEKRGLNIVGTGRKQMSV